VKGPHIWCVPGSHEEHWPMCCTLGVPSANVGCEKRVQSHRFQKFTFARNKPPTHS